jgi:sirohydrochlorin ferrochelatase
MQPIIIVAHGQPNKPAPAAAELANLAAKVSAKLPNRRILSATLAEPEALAKAIGTLGPSGVVFPLFMAGGWFTRINLPAKLKAAGGTDWQVLEPLGCNAALHDLAVEILKDAGAAPGSQVLLAAHGSFKSSVPSDIAQHLAEIIRLKLGANVTVGFIDQSPQLRDVGGLNATALCLPFFAATGDHVNEDIPAALTAAGFQGRVLPALGNHPKIPAVIAAALQDQTPVCSQNCRFQR